MNSLGLVLFQPVLLICPDGIAILLHFQLNFRPFQVKNGPHHKVRSVSNTVVNIGFVNQTPYKVVQLKSQPQPLLPMTTTVMLTSLDPMTKKKMLKLKESKLNASLLTTKQKKQKNPKREK